MYMWITSLLIMMMMIEAPVIFNALCCCFFMVDNIHMHQDGVWLLHPVAHACSDYEIDFCIWLQWTIQTPVTTSCYFVNHWYLQIVVDLYL